VVNVRAAWQRHQLQRAGAGRRVRRLQARLEGPHRIVPAIHFPQLAYSGYLTMATGGYTANRIFWPDQSYTLSADVSKRLAATS
jgi:hypothetical protein